MVGQFAVLVLHPFFWVVATLVGPADPTLKIAIVWGINVTSGNGMPTIFSICGPPFGIFKEDISGGVQGP